MFSNKQQALKAYATVGVDVRVATANPHQLILMLFEGAQVALSDAQRHLQTGDIAKKASALSKAVMIIDGGLKASLDVKSGGELGENLAGLYDYMSNRLLRANLKNDIAAVEEIAKLLAELHDAWKSIGQTPITTSASEISNFSRRV